MQKMATAEGILCIEYRENETAEGIPSIEYT